MDQLQNLTTRDRSTLRAVQATVEMFSADDGVLHIANELEIMHQDGRKCELEAIMLSEGSFEAPVLEFVVSTLPLASSRV